MSLTVTYRDGTSETMPLDLLIGIRADARKGIAPALTICDQITSVSDGHKTVTLDQVPEFPGVCLAAEVERVKSSIIALAEIIQNSVKQRVIVIPTAHRNKQVKVTFDIDQEELAKLVAQRDYFNRLLVALEHPLDAVAGVDAEGRVILTDWYETILKLSA